MKTALTPFANLLASADAKLATCWLIELVSGDILAFTDHDRDIDFNLEELITGFGYSTIPGIDGTGAQTYLSTAGYAATDVDTTSALNVDNLEVHGLLSSPSITEDDLRAGKWDFANVTIFVINWGDFGLAVGNVSCTITRSGTTATVTRAAHGLAVGDVVYIFGALQIEYDGRHVITAVPSSSTFRFTVSGSPATPATGTITYQALCGAIIMRTGKIGEVTAEGGSFRAELRGLTQAYARTLGQVTSPACRADLGDARCTKDLTAFTVTGSLTDASADGLVLYDPARVEAGPTGGVAISAISNANPGHVSLAVANPFVAGQPVTISDVVGPLALNTIVQVRNPSGFGFDLAIDTSDTSDFPAYVSGGNVTPLGGDSGYFDAGLITITSGPNAGLSREVKSYVPGQWVLWLPFPYAFDFSGPSIDYTMHAGCDKSLPTCRDRFDNVLNFRAEPYLPGVDKLVQVGRHG